MLKLILTPRAKRNILLITDNVVDYTGYVESGIKLFDDLFAHFDLLTRMPRMGKEREDNTRETFCRKYRIIYQIINDQEIHILTVIHSRMLYPRPQ